MAAILQNIKRKLARKKNLPEETGEIDTRAHDNEDGIIDLVDSLEEDSVTPNDTVSGEEEPVGILNEVPSAEKTEIDLQTGGEVVDELDVAWIALFIYGVAKLLNKLTKNYEHLFMK